jgi:hypothetical protein
MWRGQNRLNCEQAFAIAPQAILPTPARCGKQRDFTSANPMVDDAVVEFTRITGIVKG